MTKQPIEKIQINKIKNNKKFATEDEIIRESPLTIFVNGYELVTLMTLPDKLKELTIGFLASENIIDHYNQINSIEFSHQSTVVQVDIEQEVDIGLFKKRTLTSGCGKGITFSNLNDCAVDNIKNLDLHINSNLINKLMTEMQKKANFFDRTGGTHTAALADEQKLIFVIEDIGRHNTIDKIIGKALIEGINLENKLILTSGRVSSEIIIKILKQKIPILISRSAPTSSAVEIAREKDITLIGFTRGSRYNLYNDLNRIEY